jgi:1,2-phenylacetyl-CoA epoxidase PaaB subunit
MPLSKIRANLTYDDGELASPPERDLAPWVIFTRLRADGPFIYAGFVDATDGVMAVELACEHYGQDQQCTDILALDRDRTAGAAPDGSLPDDAEAAREAEYLVFVQSERGAAHESAAPQPAGSLAQAQARATAAHPRTASVWVVHPDDTERTPEGALIWRLTDQTYRLARGYAKDVRAKWEQVRRDRDIREYERDDLKETF